MTKNIQFDRYKRLISFIDQNFKDDINIQRIEQVCHYSYRNINRIFEAIHGETIGKYINRLRLEKAAQYLKYSNMGVADIAFEVSFEERSSFNRAFKKKYGFTPSAFRSKKDSSREILRRSILKKEGEGRKTLEFEIEFLPNFEFIYLEYRGHYDDILAMEEKSLELYRYGLDRDILGPRSIFFTEIKDDSEISDHLRLRHHLGFILDGPLNFEPTGLYRTKKHRKQKYAKFSHEGSHKQTLNYYTEIYAFWILEVGLELEDLPSLEYYPNYETNPRDQMITEIYIPIV